jgi:stage II sporulation protein D
MRSRFSVVLSLLISTTVLVSSGPAQAEPVTEPAITVTSTTKLTGHGFGHGRGMSQYGAQGRALGNWQSAQILEFYYPGTTVTQFVKEVRILITGDNDDDTVVVAKPGLSIADYGAKKAYKLPANGARAWKLFTSDGLTRVSYLSPTGWKRYALGGKSALSGVGEFRSSSYWLTLRTPAGDKSYRGALRYVFKNTVNRLSLESYLKGVVPTEMPASWRADALESQAVAARSYAAREMVDNPNRSYHVYDDTRSQVYGGMGVEVAKSNDAVAATAGKVLYYAGKPALTQFSSSNGGWSVAGATQDYLVAQADPFDPNASNPHRSWTVALNAAALQKAYPAIGALQKIQVTERDGNGDWGGRVLGIKLVGSKGTKLFGTAAELPGMSEFRSVLGLKSTYFTVVP